MAISVDKSMRYRGSLWSQKVRKGNFQTVTDQHGTFHIHVPAGHYSVETKSSDWVVRPIDVSYQRPEQIEIHNGGCADLALHAVPLSSRH